jgi:hypothetical protein
LDGSVGEDSNYYDDDDAGGKFLFSGACTTNGDNQLSSDGAGGSLTVSESIASSAVGSAEDPYALAWAQEIINGVNSNNPSGFLNAFMASTAAAGTAGGAAAILSGFGEGVAGASTILLGQGGFTDAFTGVYYSGYLQVGGVVGATTLNIPSAIWAQLGQTPGAQLAAIHGFISDAAVDSPRAAVHP